MAFIKRDWTPEEADNWTKEDTLTVIISPLIYILFTLGTVFAFLMQAVGFALLGGGFLLLAVMIYMINPKLDSISREYEKKQTQYLEELEKKNRWEEAWTTD